MNKTVFISYSWAEPSASIVNNWLKPSLKDVGINVSVDKDDCQYQDSIELYEQEIGNADMIIAVVSQPYLKSVNCMYEIACVLKREGNLDKRLYFVATEKTQSNEEIISYWSKTLDDAKNDLVGITVGRKLKEKELERIELICEGMGDFLVYWNDRNRMDFSKVSENNFRMVINRILHRISEAEMPEEDLLSVKV